MKDKFKFQNLETFEITDYNSAERLELIKIDSITLKDLQLSELLARSYGNYFYSYQQEKENYYSIVILRKGYEYTHFLHWLTYSKGGNLISEYEIAHFDGEGGKDSKSITKLISSNQLECEFKSIFREKNEIIYQSKYLVEIQENGIIEDSIVFDYKNQKYYNF